MNAHRAGVGHPRVSLLPLAFLAALLWLLLPACKDKEPTPTPTPKVATECSADGTSECECDNGRKGTKQCTDDGVYVMCVCASWQQDDAAKGAGSEQPTATGLSEAEREAAAIAETERQRQEAAKRLQAGQIKIIDLRIESIQKKMRRAETDAERDKLKKKLRRLKSEQKKIRARVAADKAGAEQPSE